MRLLARRQMKTTNCQINQQKTLNEFQSYGEMGCQANVIPYVDSVCSGRRKCTLEVPDIGLQGIRPCSEELTAYLEASYSCLPG